MPTTKKHPPTIPKTSKSPTATKKPRQTWQRQVPGFVALSFGLLVRLKIFHWQTRRYSQHKTADQAMEDLLDKFDQFMEEYQGVYGRIHFPRDRMLPIGNISKREIVSDLHLYLDSLVTLLPSQTNNVQTKYHGKKGMSALYNTRD